MTRSTLALLATCALALSGCKSVADGAKQTFSRTKTCPLDRVEARERKDLKPSTFEAVRTPPGDIAADPARLKMWQAEEEKTRTTWDQLDRIGEARGCDQHSFYRCHPSKSQGETCMTVSSSAASLAPPPPAGDKW